MAATTRRFPGLRDLAGRRPFRRLIATQALSQAADGLYQISLASVLIFSVEAARTPGQVTKILAVTTLPFSIVGPFTGPFIDRFSRRSVLVGSKLAMVAITVGMLGGKGTPEGVLLALAVANVSINRFFHATKSAVLPSLVSPDRYLVANAVSTTTGMVTSLTGAVVGGIVVDATSPTVGVAAAAVAMALSAGLAATLPLPPGERRGLAGMVSELRDNLRDVRAGLRVLRSSSQAKYGVISIWLIRAMLGFVVLAALVLLRERFDIQASGFSTVFVALGIGGFFGALLVPPLARRVGYRGIAPIAMTVAALAAAVGGPIPSMFALLPTVFLGGLATYAAKIASDTLIQRGVADAYRGRAFTVYELGYNGAFVVAGLIPTLLRGPLGDVGVILLTASLALLTAAWLGLWSRKLAEPIDVRLYAGARADESPREVVIRGETLAVEEVERSWQEERDGKRLRCYRLRLENGRRIQISQDQVWSLDRELAPSERTSPGRGQ